jgi:hypothetical protein
MEVTATRVPRPNGAGTFEIEELRALGFHYVAPEEPGYISGQIVASPGTVHHQDGCRGAWDRDGRAIWIAAPATDEQLAFAYHLCQHCLNEIGLVPAGPTYVPRPPSSRVPSPEQVEARRADLGVVLTDEARARIAERVARRRSER